MTKFEYARQLNNELFNSVKTMQGNYFDVSDSFIRVLRELFEQRDLMRKLHWI